MKTRTATVELYSCTNCDGSKEFYLRTKSSNGSEKLAWFNNLDAAVNKMQSILKESSRFRYYMHSRIRIDITKDFIN
jgi:hypothetical protein